MSNSRLGLHANLFPSKLAGPPPVKEDAEHIWIQDPVTGRITKVRPDALTLPPAAPPGDPWSGSGSKVVGQGELSSEEW